MEIDVMHLKELLEITRSKHNDELKDLEERFLQEEIGREGDDGDEPDKVKGKIRSLQRRQQEVEEVVAEWVEDAEQSLQKNRRVRADVLLDFRIRQGVDGIYGV